MEQIAWEYWRLRHVSSIAFWFAQETIQPITLFELGAALERDVRIVIGIDPLYERRLDVTMQANLKRPRIPIVHTLLDLGHAIIQSTR